MQNREHKNFAHLFFDPKNTTFNAKNDLLGIPKSMITYHINTTQSRHLESLKRKETVVLGRFWELC